MEAKTRYAYEKRIKELEDKNKQLTNDLYEYRMACSEIYNGCVEVLGKQATSMSTSWILSVLKRCWRKF